MELVVQSMHLKLLASKKLDEAGMNDNERLFTTYRQSIRVWNRTLSNIEIRSLYVQNLSSFDQQTVKIRELRHQKILKTSCLILGRTKKSIKKYQPGSWRQEQKYQCSQEAWSVPSLSLTELSRTRSTPEWLLVTTCSVLTIQNIESKLFKLRSYRR